MNIEELIKVRIEHWEPKLTNDDVGVRTVAVYIIDELRYLLTQITTKE